jgi:hypothetical protein
MGLFSKNNTIKDNDVEVISKKFFMENSELLRMKVYVECEDLFPHNLVPHIMSNIKSQDDNVLFVVLVMSAIRQYFVKIHSLIEFLRERDGVQFDSRIRTMNLTTYGKIRVLNSIFDDTISVEEINYPQILTDYYPLVHLYSNIIKGLKQEINFRGLDKKGDTKVLMLVSIFIQNDKNFITVKNDKAYIFSLDELMEKSGIFSYMISINNQK